MTSPASVIAQTPLFADNFDDDNADGWIVTHNTCLYDGQPATWVVLNKMYGIKINGGNCQTNTIYDLNYVPLNIEYSFEVDMTLTSTSMDRNFLFKYLDKQNRYGLHLIDNKVFLELVVGGIQRDVWGTYAFQNNGTYHFKVDLLHDKIVVYINDTIVHSFSENSITAFPNSKVGLRASAGTMPSSEVWFDNMEVKTLGLVPTPTPTSPPPPTPTPQLFELPVSYEGREESNENNFISAFWSRLTATFDHHRGGPHQPFTGEKYKKKDCQTGDYGIQCYNSHNGTDFDGDSGDPVYSVADGAVLYASEHDSNSCTPEASGFGCVVIAKYNNTPSGTVYGLYAHLNKINSKFSNYTQYSPISITEEVGKIGNTGCEPCGTHLHFGVLGDVIEATALNIKSKKKMGKKDWQVLLHEIRPEKTPSVKHFCTYSAPNEMRFTFQDPLGWNPFFGHDPWQKACGVSSPYLWKHNVGFEKSESLTNFLQPIENFLGI